MAAANLPTYASSKTKVGYSESPNPSWTYGQSVDLTKDGQEWLEGTKLGWKQFDTDKEDLNMIYQLMKTGIIPRPVAFVSTISEDGVENIAPYSFFNQVSSHPPVVSISANTRPRIKDTSHNIQTTKGYTINIISEPWVEQANMASVDAPVGVDEWAVCGLTKLPSVHVKAPRVKESAFTMECEFYQLVEIVDPADGTVSGNLILGRVKCIHVRNDMFNERGYVDPTKLKPIARLGDISYASIGPVYRIPGRSWENEEEDIKATVPVYRNL